MDFLENIPFIIFNASFFIILIAFVFGAVVLAFAWSNPQKIERGRKIILKSLYALLILLLVALVFFLVSYFLKRGEVLRPAPASEDFPQAPFPIFPPGPEISVPGK